jgi:hypothetical protein
MMVVLIAHAKIKRFENPETEAYDRYSPRLNKHASALVQEWCDDRLRMRSGAELSIDTITSRIAELRLFNLPVAGGHSYTVGQSGILVHNKAEEVLPEKPNVPIVPPKLTPEVAPAVASLARLRPQILRKNQKSVIFLIFPATWERGITSYQRLLRLS